MLDYRWKRLCSGLLALALVVGMLPPVAVAAEETQATEVVEVLETEPVTTEPVETEPVETTVATEGVTEPVEETEATEETVPETTAETEVEITESTEETVAETTEATEPALPENVAAVQALIDALPTLDAVTAEDYDAVQDAYDAFDALTEEEKALIYGAEVFVELFAWFDSQIVTLATVASGTCGENLTWLLDDTGTLTISGTGNMSDYDSFSDAPWYSNRSSITAVVIEEGVTSIGGYAFESCNNMVDISIPESVERIGNWAFSACHKLESIVIPGKISEIEEDTFWGCMGLASVTLPDGLQSIGEEAFIGCMSLTSITIPEGVTTIGAKAFRYCESLASINIPKSVSSIGEGVFAYSDIAISIAAGNTHYIVEDGSLLDAGKTILLYVPNKRLGTYTIPDGVVTIGAEAFAGCQFSQVNISESVKTIGKEAFRESNRLSKLYIPKSVTNIADHAFLDVSEMTEFVVDGNNPNYSSHNGFLLNKAGTLLIQAPIGRKGVVTVPDGVDTIGQYAFCDADAMTAVKFPEGVTTIERETFMGCENLCYVVLPSTLTYVHSGAFMGARKLTDVYYAGTEEQWKQIKFRIWNYVDGNWILTWIDETLLNATIHYGEEVPDDTARDTCGENLTWTLDDTGTLTISGTGAMYDFGWDSDTQTPLTPWYKYRSQIKKLVIEKGVTTIGEEAFDGCYNMTSVSIADSVTSIGIWAFQACDGLTTITIPKIVKTIGDGAFSGCLNLTAFKVASGNTSFKASNGLLMTYDGKVLVSAAGGLVGNVTVPKGVTTIRDWAFGSCRKISGIILPDMLTTIGEAAFWDCESLTSITIPNGVTSICNSMFQYCFELTRVTLPAGITEIEPGAFYECNKLTDVYYAGTQEQWGAISIGDGNSCLDNATIHIETLGSLEIRPVEAIRLVSGQSQTLTAYDLDGKKVTVTWSVDNSDAATITSAGKLTAKAVDAATTVTVTATDKTGAAGTKTITILPKVTSVTIGDVETTVDMYATSTLTLTATTAPEDALNDVTWVSGNEKVATVDETGTVTLLKPGTVTITATATDGSKNLPR